MRVFGAHQRDVPERSTRASVVRFHRTPCLSVSSAGVLVMATADEVETCFARMMERVKRVSHGRSEFVDLQVTMLSEQGALLRIRGARYKTDGELLEPIGATYTFRRASDGWKMAVLTLHDPDVVVGPVSSRY